MPHKRGRHSYKVHKVNISLWLDQYQLKALDEAAKNELTTRSQLIRAAINWYLWPSSRALGTTEDYVYETIKQRRSLAATMKKLKENGREIDD